MSSARALSRNLLLSHPAAAASSFAARAFAVPPARADLRGASAHSAAAAMAPQQQRRKQGTVAVPKGYTEDWSKGAMLRFEESLPKLPVPDLHDTAAKYLKSVHPLLSAEEYGRTKQAVEDFVRPGGQGEELQKRLIARRDDPENRSWIYEWWNSAAYLGDNGPVVPFVSYFYSHRDDRKRRDPAKRAASITTAVLDFKSQVDEGTLEPDYMRKEPIAMSSFWWMFNTSRIPARPDCYPQKYNYKEHPYIIAIRKNQFFKIPHEIDGKQLTTAELEHQFRRVYENAEKGPAVGTLTAERRDVWTKSRQALLDANPANKASLEAIEASSFVVCLDDASPVTLEERAHQYWHGDGSNRFYDKPLQFIVCDNGKSGFMGEHSMMDGMATHRLNDHALKLIFKNELDFDNPSVRSNLPDPLPLKFVIDAETTKNISTATAFHETTVAKHDLVVEAFQGYGKGLIKKFKCSPDAYVQMVIQLAYFKMYGKNRPTYESAMTRKFQQGRTEAIRTVSDESVAFCNAVADPDVDAAQCEKLFRAALAAHVKYISFASDGKGCDRHLFGLKRLVKEGEELPAIFKDPAYSYSSYWYVSTSQLSSEYFNGYGWSQVTDEGWGIAYMINENSMNFNIVSQSLGNARMAFFLNEAAQEIRDILMPSLAPEKAKL